MANVEINDMVADTTPLDTDELEIQKTGGGLSRKMTRKNILKGVYGIMSVQGNTTAESTVDTTPRIITAWGTDGLSNSLTVSHVDNYITCVSGFEGDFRVDLSLSFSGSNSASYQITIYKYDLSITTWQDTGFSSDRKLGSGGDVGSLTLTGFVSLEVGDRLAIYQSTTDGSAMTVTEAQMAVERL